MQEVISQQFLLRSKITTAILTLPTVILLAQNVHAEPLLAGVGSTVDEITSSEKDHTIGLVEQTSIPQTSPSSQTLGSNESKSSQSVSYQCDLYSSLSDVAILACQGFQTQPPSTLEGTSI
jgi:hypothetical protein